MEEQEEKQDYSFVKELTDLVEEQCVEGNVVRFSITEEGFQKVVIQLDEDEPWFTLTLTDLPEEGEENNYEGIAEVSIRFVIEIIEREIASAIDAKAILN